jgi:hypothetical protein
MAIKWSSWESLGKPQEADIGRPFVQRNQDGRLEIFANGAGAIFNLSQVSPNGPWRDGWRSKGRPSAEVGIKSHVVGKNADGRLEIFAVGEDFALWQKWQVAPNNGWSDTWKTLGHPFAGPSLGGQLTVGRNQDGRQEVFAVAGIENFRLVSQIWQTVPAGAVGRCCPPSSRVSLSMGARKLEFGTLIASPLGAIKMVARNYS